MSRPPIISVSLLLFAAHGAFAQDTPDFFSLTFTPAVISKAATPPSPRAPDATAPAAPTEADRARLADSVQQKLDSIAKEESLNGERSSRLIEQLASLAAAYRELGEYLPAITALQHAKDITRVNDGLHSLDQAKLIEQMVDSADAIGPSNESAALQESLLELAQQNEGDPQVPSLLTAVADRQMNVVETYLDTNKWSGIRDPIDAARGSGWDPSTSRVGRDKAVSRLAQIRSRYDTAIHEALTSDNYELGDSLGESTELADIYRLIDTMNDFLEEGPLPRGYPPVWEPDPPASDRERALGALRRARRLDSAALQAALRNGSTETGEYLGLEQRVIETYYFEMAHPELHPPEHVRPRRSDLKDVIYATGASTLQAKVIETLTRPAPALAAAAALVELGDWRLLFAGNGMALENYQDAYDLLVKENVPREAIDALFSPDIPAILPEFSAETLQFDPAHHYRGYIDVLIETGKYGSGHVSKVIEASPAASKAIQKRLNSHVALSRFRPRFVDGHPVRSDQFSLRYYFDYQ